MTVDRESLDAAFAYYRSRGFLHGEEATHAETLQKWAAEVWAWFRYTQDDAQAEVAAARRSVARADQALNDLAASVQTALDATDLDRPGAFAEFVKAIAAIPAVADRLEQAPEPRPLEVVA